MAKRTVRNGRAQRMEGSPWILGFVLLYISLQILIPLRHLLYKRDLRWTHEGIDFSWCMMADRHDFDGGIMIEDPRTKNVYLNGPDMLLTHRQFVMAINPYMLVQYARFLKRYLKQHTDIENPIIRTDIQISVNGKPFQYMYDPNCDLSEVTYSPFKDLEWIMPFKKP